MIKHGVLKVALNVGADFKQRWLNVPEAVRQAYTDELTRISDLLKPDTSLQSWISHDQQQYFAAQKNIEHAYAELKAELIEQARIRKQQALEKALEEKREIEKQNIARLQYEEHLQQEHQTQHLQKFRENLELEVQGYAARYQPNPHLYAIQKDLSSLDHSLDNEFDSIQLRLELEAEVMIEKTVQQFRQQLTQIARDEIQVLLEEYKSEN